MWLLKHLQTLTIFVFYFNSATDDAQKMMQMSGGGGFGFNASQVSKNLNYCQLCVLFYESNGCHECTDLLASSLLYFQLKKLKT